MRRCDNCRFHSAPPDHCRRKPPKFKSDTDSAFRIVRADWWCGEHRLSVWKFVKNLFKRK